MRRILWCLIAMPLMAHAGNTVSDPQRVVFKATVVASACHAVVSADASGNNLLTFATYDRSTGVPVPARDFTLRLYESGASMPVCTAFRAGNMATIEFGNPGQLDDASVVTQGRSAVNYPVDFAAQGQFRFRAQPVGLAQARAGEYSGALAFVVTYH